MIIEIRNNLSILFLFFVFIFEKQLKQTNNNYWNDWRDMLIENLVVAQEVSVNALLLSDQRPRLGFFKFKSELKKTLFLAVCRRELDADRQPVLAKPHR